MSVAQIRSDGELLAFEIYKRTKNLVESIEREIQEIKEGHTMSFSETLRTPTTLKRLLIGASAGLFSCTTGIVIIS